jgi:hypothetical protein
MPWLRLGQSPSNYQGVNGVKKNPLILISHLLDHEKSHHSKLDYHYLIDYSNHFKVSLCGNGWIHHPKKMYGIFKDVGIHPQMNIHTNQATLKG